MAQRGSLHNTLYANGGQKAPEAGMGATIIQWSDRTAVRISRVSADGKKLWTTAVKSKRTDNNGMSDAQAYEYEDIPNSPEQAWSLRKDGQWRVVGLTATNSNTLLIGVMASYYDYSF